MYEEIKSEQVTSPSPSSFTLPADFKATLDVSCTAREAEDLQSLLMQANFIFHERSKIQTILLQDPSLSSKMVNFEKIYQSSPNKITKELISIKDDIRLILSYYNRKSRISVNTKLPYGSRWPVPELLKIEKGMNPALLPSPSPCEYVEEKYCWSCFGAFDQQSEWLGHGYFWRPQSLDDSSEIMNMAGSALQDYDVLEEKFCHLRKASILVADYPLLRKDFPQLKDCTDQEIDKWLLNHAAYFSDGQVQRIETEFMKKFGLDKEKDGLDSVIDRTKMVSGIRQRSGGRAANLFVDGKYSFDSNGFLKADLLNVKGLGTHSRSNFKDSSKLTGMLNLGDALRELALERLIQRIFELEGVTDQLNSVLTYAIIETGLKYAEGEIDPASGYKNQRSVLTVRQSQSRAFVHYNGYNFSGSLLMTGEDEEPSPVMKYGMRLLRTILNKYGISSEMAPQALFAKDLEMDILSKEFADLSVHGTWNIQTDATFSHLMDFSDYFVLPMSSLNEWWKMTTDTLFSAMCLEGNRLNCEFKDKKLFLKDCPKLIEFVCGANDLEKGKEAIKKRIEELSNDQVILDNQGITSEEKKVTVGVKPKYSMCWYFELDDSGMGKWSLARANGETGKSILETIEKHLPVKKG